MQQIKEQTKRMSGVFVRNISQQFGSIVSDKTNCKCDLKDLDQLKEVHLVSSRRQLFEEKERFSKNTYQHQNDGKRLSAKNELNHDLNVTALRRRSAGGPNAERTSKASGDHHDDHNNNVLGVARNDQDRVEKYRNYVIKSIIHDFNDDNVDTHGGAEDANEDTKSMENCEEVVNEMISNETRRSLHSLALSLTFMQSLLGIEKKQQENVSDNVKDEEYQPEPSSRLSTEFRTGGNDNSSDSTCNCNSLQEESEAQSYYDMPVLTNDFDVPIEDNPSSFKIGDNKKKRRPRLTRFNRLSLKKQKYTEQQSDDEDDSFGSMIGDDDYFLEVINADSGVVLNKISLQRICISNILINGPEQNHITSANGEPRDDINITTTVYYDQNSNPRIEKVIDENKLHVAMSEDNLAPPLSPTLPNKRQNLIIKELLETEVTFIEGLRIIIEEYMAYFKEHPEPKYSNPSYLCFLFGNVEEMYVEAQKFHEDLLTCDYSIERVASTFLEHKNLFEVFVEYIKNKPTSQLFSLGLFQNVLKERHAQLQEKGRLGLDSYLLTPIQRLGRYILFAENLQKVTKAKNETCDVLNEATDFLKREMRRADTFVAAVSIGNSPIDLTKKGSFVAKETLNIKKKYKSVVFLFQDIVVFTTPNQQRSESYFYKDSLEMSDLTIRSYQEQPLTFNLRSFSNSRNDEEGPHSFELEAPSEKVKKKWVQEIETLLWEQLEKCKADAMASGETVYRKFNRGSPGNNSSKYYKKKRQPEAPPPTPPTNSQRHSVFYVEC